MLDPRARLPVRPCHDHVSDLQISLEIFHPIPVHPQHALDLRFVGVLERHPVIGALHHDLAGAPRGDPVEHPDALADQILLDDEVGVPFREDPHLPAVRVETPGRR